MIWGTIGKITGSHQLTALLLSPPCCLFVTSLRHTTLISFTNVWAVTLPTFLRGRIVLDISTCKDRKGPREPGSPLEILRQGLNNLTEGQIVIQQKDWNRRWDNLVSSMGRDTHIWKMVYSVCGRSSTVCHSGSNDYVGISSSCVVSRRWWTWSGLCHLSRATP